MSWESWARDQVVALGFGDEVFDDTTVQQHLEALDADEAALNELRAQLITMAASRPLTNEEFLAFEIARKNHYASCAVTRAALVALGVPNGDLPALEMLAQLPEAVKEELVPFSAYQSGEVLYLSSGSSLAFGAVRLGAYANPGAMRRETAASFGAVTAVAALKWAGLVLAILVTAAALAYLLRDLFASEVVMHRVVSEENIRVAESWAEVAQAYYDSLAACDGDAACVAAIPEPSSATPFPDRSQISPILSVGTTAGKILGGVAVIGGLALAAKVYFDSKK